MTLAIGRLVFVNVSADPAHPVFRAAIVTAVWSEVCINVQLMLDGENDAALLAGLGTSDAHPYWLTSITQASAGDGSVGFRQWCWPFAC